MGMTGHGRRWGGAHCLFASIGPRGVTQDAWIVCTCCSIALPHHLVHSREPRVMEQASLALCSWPKWVTWLDSVPFPDLSTSFLVKGDSPASDFEQEGT